MKRLFSFLAAVSFVAFAGCSKPEPQPGTDPGSNPGTEEPVTPVDPAADPELSLAISELVMAVDREIDFAPFIATDAELSALTVSSDAPGVVEVTEANTLVAKSVGEATVTVSCGKVSAEVAVKVEDGFMMYVSDFFTITGRGVVACGNPESGTIHVTDHVNVFNVGATYPDRETSVVSIKVSGSEVTEAGKSSGRADLMLKGMDKDWLNVGSCIVSKDNGTVTLTKEMKVIVTNVKEGTTVVAGDVFDLRIGTSSVTAVFTDLGGETKLHPGNVYQNVTVSLKDERVVAYVGERLVKRSAGNNAVEMVVVEAKPCDPVPVPEENQELSLTKTSGIVSPSDTISLVPYIKLKNLNLEDLEFTSSNPSVATVDDEMRIVPQSAGKAEITVSYAYLSDKFTIEVEDSFAAFVKDVMSITGKGTVCVSSIKSGTLHRNDLVKILSMSATNSNYNTYVKAIEAQRKTFESVSASDGGEWGLYVGDGVARTDLVRGSVMMAPDTRYLQPARKFVGTIRLKSKEEGGRHTPIFAGFSPLYNNGLGSVLNIALTGLAGEEMLMPGNTYHNCEFTVDSKYILPAFLGETLVDATDGIEITVTDFTPETVTYETPDVAASLSAWKSTFNIAATDAIDLLPYLEVRNIDLSTLSVSSSDASVASAAFSSDFSSLDLTAAAAGTTKVSVTGTGVAVEFTVNVEDSFAMAVEDLAYVTGRGLVAGGTVNSGTIHFNTPAQVVNPSETKGTLNTTITGIEMFRKLVDECVKGDNPGLLLRGLDTDKVEAGAVVMSMTTSRNVVSTSLKLKVHVKSEAEGGVSGTEIKAGTARFQINGYDYNVTVSSDSPTLRNGDDGIVTVSLPAGYRAVAYVGQSCGFVGSGTAVATATVLDMN